MNLGVRLGLLVLVSNGVHLRRVWRQTSQCARKRKAAIHLAGGTRRPRCPVSIEFVRRRAGEVGLEPSRGGQRVDYDQVRDEVARELHQVEHNGLRLACVDKPEPYEYRVPRQPQRDFIRGQPLPPEE